MAEELFGPIFVPDRFREAVSGSAWLQAMLDAEARLAAAPGAGGLIPRRAAEAVASCCEAAAASIRRSSDARGARRATPSRRSCGRPPAVSEVSEDAARYVHKGATSQDIIDTAAMLVWRNARWA